MRFRDYLVRPCHKQPWPRWRPKCNCGSSRCEWYGARAFQLIYSTLIRIIGNIIHRIESGTYHPNDRNPKASAGGKKEKFTADTVCWIASCTKLMTTVSVMQCVERGILDLDDDVSTTWLPEYKDPEILVRVEQDDKGNARLIMKKASRKITLSCVL
jgi:Beta-lactamase